MLQFSALYLLVILIVLNFYSSYSIRIVGGASAYEGQFPFQVSLRGLGSHVCGGSIINRNFVLTAAHCVGNWKASVYNCYQPSDYTVRAGSTSRFSGGVLVSVSEILIHENYGNYLNDIALIRLSEPLIYSRNIQPISLATHETPKDTDVVITGWGLTANENEISPEVLQWNTLKTLNRMACKDVYTDSVAILCLEHKEGNGSCNLDSGGPAISNGKLVGVANYVYYACGSTYPEAFANVYYHADWIRQHAGGL